MILKKRFLVVGLYSLISVFVTPVLARDSHHKGGHSADHGSDHAAPASVSAEQSMKWLQNGNLRFQKNAFRRDGRAPKDVQRLKDGQAPHAIVLSCSDSRVPPEHIFDQGLGEVFVVRTAGQALNNNVIASIEYALEHLGSKLIVVMGHTSCGAVKAAAGSKAGVSIGSPALDALVGEIRPRLPVTPSGVKDMEPESLANVRGVAEDLSRQSAIIREKTASGEVVIKRAMYHLNSGKVDWY